MRGQNTYTAENKALLEERLGIYGGQIRMMAIAYGHSESTVRRAIKMLGIDIAKIREAGPVAPGAQVAPEAPAEPAKPHEIVALERQVIALRSEKATRERTYREMAKAANVVQGITGFLAPHMERLQLPAIKAPKFEPGDRTPVTFQQVLSDLHWGKEFSAPSINGLNAYNPYIAARRVQHVVDVLGEYHHDQERKGAPVERLVLPIIGDMINGNLHPEDEDNYADMIVQAIDCALVTAQAIWELAHKFPHIDVIMPAGDNHSRLTKKSATSAKAFGTCMNTMYAQCIAILLRGLPHVKVHIDISHQTYYTIYGETYAACHGNMLKGGGGSLGIPAYGMRRHHDGNIAETVILAKRQAKELRLNEGMTDQQRVLALYGLLEGIVDHTFVGHFHTYQLLEFTTGDLRISPSAMGTDPYARDALRKPGGGPRQIMQVIHPRLGIVGDHVIRLEQHQDPVGPSRYHWGVIDGGGNMADMMDDWLRNNGSGEGSIG